MRDEDFEKRRLAAREKLDALPGNYSQNSNGRNVFFNAVYAEAKDDEAAVPWADLKPKQHLLDYLRDHPGSGNDALDVACGLGDNAEALASAGYDVTAFDIVEKAISWAKKRFENSAVNYQTADLFSPPDAWVEGFDLIHECYTLQALPESMVRETAKAITDLVAPGGVLLVYTRWRPDGAEANGPPWPLEEANLALPERFGLEKVDEDRFALDRGDVVIPHSFTVWQKPSS